jgi:peptidoglycan pentaglycine glycine transferase (the first glycine)
MASVSLKQWTDFLKDRPSAHFLQTGEWGELKSAFGWEVVRLIVGDVGAQVLLRKLPFGLRAGYIPKAQLAVATPGARERFWTELDGLCRQHRAIFCKIEPDEWEPREPGAPTGGHGQQQGSTVSQASPQNIQPRRTVIIDLRGSDERILSRMKPKCRYNIGLAQKKGVTVRPWADLSSFHSMVQATARRDEFGVHSADYYRRAFELFHSAGMVELLVATYGEQPLAALMVFARGPRAWYVYGASNDQERNRMPNYLLQWEAMRWAKQRGCLEYDLWGVPDEEESILEANFEERHDGLWGVYRFKRGFGGELRRAPGATDRVYSPLLYQLYLRRMGPGGGL